MVREQKQVKYLFVYGSLRRGMSLHQQLKGLRFIGRGKIQGALYMLPPYNGEAFPGAVTNSESGYVIGEIYEFQTADIIHRLDAEEEYNSDNPTASLFIRKIAEVTLEDGTTCNAWAYFYNRPLKSAVLIPSGDYVEYQRSHPGNGKKII